jgi:hypothetical protein
MKVIHFVFQQCLTVFIGSGFMMYTSVDKFLASGTLTFFIVSLTDTDLLEARSLCRSAASILVSLTDTDLLEARSLCSSATHFLVSLTDTDLLEARSLCSSATHFLVSLTDTDLLEARSLCSSATFFLVSLTDTDLAFDSRQRTVTKLRNTVNTCDLPRDANCQTVGQELVHCQTAVFSGMSFH